MTKEQLIELLQDKKIKWSFVEINISNRVVAAFEVDEILNYGSKVTFTFSDRKNGLENWRGERAPYFELSFEDIIDVEQIIDFNIYGKYQVKISLNNMYINLHFDIDEVILNIGKHGLELDSYDNNEKIYLEKIISHDGMFFINVNAGDFVKESNFEVYNMIFTDLKLLRQNELISFDNSKMEPIRYTADNTPVFSLYSCSNFYIDLKNMVRIEEIDAKKYQDVFEYPTEKIFNITMKDKTIITIGLDE